MSLCQRIRLLCLPASRACLHLDIVVFKARRRQKYPKRQCPEPLNTCLLRLAYSPRASLYMAKLIM